MRKMIDEKDHWKIIKNRAESFWYDGSDELEEVEQKMLINKDTKMFLELTEAGEECVYSYIIDDYSGEPLSHNLLEELSQRFIWFNEDVAEGTVNCTFEEAFLIFDRHLFDKEYVKSISFYLEDTIAHLPGGFSPC